MSKNPEKLENGFHRYLGDGVYASVDQAGQVWLASGDHTNRVIALEPAVMRSLDFWRKDLAAALQNKSAEEAE